MEDKILKQIKSEVGRIINEAPYKMDGLGRFYGYHTITSRLIEAGAEYGYNIKESVDEKLLRQVQRLTTWLRMEGNDDDIKMILEAEEVMNEAELTASNQENNEGWISVEDRLPKHLIQCVFLLNNGNVCIGKVKYFEHGDSELIDFMGKGINMYKRIYRNWEIKSFDSSEEFEVTHWMPLPNPPKEK